MSFEREPKIPRQDLSFFIFAFFALNTDTPWQAGAKSHRI